MHDSPAYVVFSATGTAVVAPRSAYVGDAIGTGMNDLANLTTMAATDHHVPLGRTGWMLWRDAALRGAGFPAEWILEICDDELAAAADAVDERRPATREQYATVYTAAVGRLSAAIQRAATESRFREAVTWQNPGLIRDCVDKAASGEARNARGRAHELTIASYLQRYCLKNDTVGFCGPVGWARIGPEDTGLSAAPGANLLSRRTTYFENWAIDGIAEVIAERPEVWPWLRPRMVRSASLTGWTMRLPFRKPATLSAAEVRMLRQCDGRRTVRDIVGDPVEAARVKTLLRLRELGAVQIDLSVALSAWPERELAALIDTIGDPAARARAAATLSELVSARDAVAAAAGQPGRLAHASQTLAATFERITGRGAARRAGRAYAGRTLVYEDTVRDVDVRLGRRVTDQLAAPLGLVLDSAVWFANAVGERCEAMALELLDRELARSGRQAMPLLQLAIGVLPELGLLGTTSDDSPLISGVMAEFQQRWREVLGLPLEALESTRRHQVAASAIAERADAAFATGPPRWSGAGWHSPDVMLAADNAAALGRGDLDVILGEVHCAANTLEGRIFVCQHPASDRLPAASAASHLDRRIIVIPRRDAQAATSRVSWATEMMLPSYQYVCIGEESFAPPAGGVVVPMLDLVVQRRADGLIVRHRDGGREYGFLEVLGEPLSALIAQRFQPIGGGTRHRPRVTIDRMVLSREAWTFPATGADWAFARDERDRYARARQWRAAHGLPERGFFRVPVELKPMAIDFRSLTLVNLLAKSIRRSAEAGQREVTITEMLPDIDRLWLEDARGARYTAELRIVAVRSPVPGGSAAGDS